MSSRDKPVTHASRASPVVSCRRHPLQISPGWTLSRGYPCTCQNSLDALAFRKNWVLNRSTMSKTPMVRVSALVYEGLAEMTMPSSLGYDINTQHSRIAFDAPAPGHDGTGRHSLQGDELVLLVVPCQAGDRDGVVRASTKAVLPAG